MPKEGLRAELKHLVKLAEEHGLHRVSITFGHAWNFFHPNWKPKIVKPCQIIEEIQNAEEATKGDCFFGEDDVELAFGNFKITYCHHDDIHLHWNERGQVVEEVLARWKQNSITYLFHENPPKQTGEKPNAKRKT
ncbi:TPA: hypothetical protein HA318_00330 [Candidatus Micrarchaeota archaeon]|nr:hypothetical protein [Candidatus Micrarchaeota archaeon]